MAPPTYSNVLVILYPGFSVQDSMGPIEVFREAQRPEILKVTIASETEITEAGAGVLVKRHVALDQDLINNLNAYDVLLVPGAEEPRIMAVANDPSSLFMQLIKRFASLPPSAPGTLQPILFTVCTGALFPGKLGIFNGGRYCTTHWGFYDHLAKLNTAADEKSPGKILRSRYVDSGPNSYGVRILTAGGLTCGIDAALYVLYIRALVVRGTGHPNPKEIAEDVARNIAEQLDYAWRKTEGVTFDENYV